MKIPEHYLPVMPYLILDDATAFLEFAKSVFYAQEQMIVPGPKERTIMHGEIKIHDAVIMFAQASKDWTAKPSGMFLYVGNLDDVYLKAVANHATILMPPSTQEYGYTAGFEDPYGNQWWITQGEKD